MRRYSYRKQKNKRRNIKRIRSRRRLRQDGGNDMDTIKASFFIERKDKNAPKEISGVPLVIYRSWMTYDITKRMNNTIIKSLEKSPEFDNYLYTDKECLEFIEKHFEPNVANAFKSLKPGAFKSDLWRYCILYKNGGVYIDIKMELSLPLKDIIEKYPKLFVIDSGIDKTDTQIGLWNGFMASPPGNEVFKLCIDEIVLNCKNKQYTEGVLSLTGPILLGRMTDKLEGRNFSDNLVFSMKGDKKIYYNDIVILSEYIGYREDQNTQDINPQYYNMWYDKNVFDNSIAFE